MSANTAGMCASFKKELLQGYHAFDSSYRSADSFKGALYQTGQTIGPATTAYSATGEVSGTNYAAGGTALTWNAPATGGTTGYVSPNANLTWSNVTTQSFDCLLVYNASQGNRAVSVHVFQAQQITAGTLTLTMPANDQNNALIRIA